MPSACTTCGHSLDGGAFCGHCGARAPGAAAGIGAGGPSPDARAQYQQVLAGLGSEGGLAPDDLPQLGALRARLGLSQADHDSAVQELGLTLLKAPSVALAVDEAALGYLVPGAPGLLRAQLTLLDGAPLSAVELSGAFLEAPASQGPVLPGAPFEFSARLVAIPAGVHALELVLRTADLRGVSRSYRAEALVLRVQAAPQAVHIDQRSARVVDNSGLSLSSAGAVGPAAFRALSLRPTGASPEPAAPRPSPGRVSFEVEAAGRVFRASGVLAEGDIATVFSGSGPAGEAVAIKVARDRGDNDLIQAEVQTLALLRSTQSPMHKHLPVVVGQLRTSDGRVGTVFEALDGLDLGTIRARFPAGVPARHLIWIARRGLAALGFAHSVGVLHGNVEPAHILIRASDHNVWLVDWSWSIVRPAETGQGFKALNELYGPPEAAARRAPSPASDLYSLGRVLIHAAGGDPATGTPPESLQPPLARLLRFMALGSQGGRAQDAFELFRRFEAVRQELWGAHQFEDLVIPPG